MGEVSHFGQLGQPQCAKETRPCGSRMDLWSNDNTEPTSHGHHLHVILDVGPHELLLVLDQNVVVERQVAQCVSVPRVPEVPVEEALVPDIVAVHRPVRNTSHTPFKIYCNQMN